MLKEVAAGMRKKCFRVDIFYNKKLYILINLCNDNIISFQLLLRIKCIRSDVNLNRIEPQEQTLSLEMKNFENASIAPFPNAEKAPSRCVSIYENVSYDSAYDSDELENDANGDNENETYTRTLYGELFDNAWNQTIESLVNMSCSGHHHT